MIQRIAAGLATCGALSIAGGAAIVHPAAGLITLGVQAIAGAYVVAYLGRAR